MQNKAKIRENTERLQKFVDEKYKAGELDNQSMVQFFEQAGQYLNLQTIPDYAKANGLTYQGVKKCRKVEKLFGVSFVVDND